jgi:hypothetical protein
MKYGRNFGYWYVIIDRTKDKLHLRDLRKAFINDNWHMEQYNDKIVFMKVN